jgi:hypothetical protein
LHQYGARQNGRGMSATNQPVRDREVTILADRAGLVSENQLLQGRLREGRVFAKVQLFRAKRAKRGLGESPRAKAKGP